MALAVHNRYVSLVVLAMALPASFFDTAKRVR